MKRVASAILLLFVGWTGAAFGQPSVEDFYRGPYDSHGTSVIKGRAFGSEAGWTDYIPYAGNRMFPDNLFNARDHAALLGHAQALFRACLLDAIQIQCRAIHGSSSGTGTV